jgi:CBS domain-containing protein
MRLCDVLDSKGRHVHSASPNDTMMDVVRKLVAHNIGALPVVDEHGRLKGIVSERDILRLLVRDVESLQSARLAEHMTRDVLTAEPNDDVDSCLNTMTEQRIRHLPVCEQGKLTGMISLGDLVKSQLDHAVFETRQLTAMMMGQYPV